MGSCCLIRGSGTHPRKIVSCCFARYLRGHIDITGNGRHIFDIDPSEATSAILSETSSVVLDAQTYSVVIYPYNAHKYDDAGLTEGTVRMGMGGRKRRGLFVAVVGGCLLASAAAVTPSVAATPTVRAAEREPSAAVQLFASEVETLGADRFPNVFSGATLTSAGVTDVYTRLASDVRLVDSIKRINKAKYPVDIIGVSRSYNQLNALSAALLAANAHLLKIGIDLSQSSPDPASGSVLVIVKAPTKARISALASATASRLSASTSMTST
jgi:hypothetical protein